jgi:hypothetical protein
MIATSSDTSLRGNGVQALRKVHRITRLLEVRGEASISPMFPFGGVNHQTANRNRAKLMGQSQSADEIATASIGQSDVAQQDVKSPSRGSAQRGQKRIHRQDLVAQVRKPNGKRGPRCEVIFD